MVLGEMYFAQYHPLLTQIKYIIGFVSVCSILLCSNSILRQYMGHVVQSNK